MNEYMFYTVQGETQGETGEDSANCQVLGTAKGKTIEHAWNEFLTSEMEDYLEHHGFDADEILVVLIIRYF